MSEPSVPFRFQEAIEQQAAAWVWRCDRGLSAAEQDEFSAWIAADPRHSLQLARHRQHWKRLDTLAQWCPEHGTRPNPDLLAPPRRRQWRRLLPATLAVAAATAVAVVFFVRGSHPIVSDSSAAALAVRPEEDQRVLPDGTVVELNRGAVVAVDFSARERRVWLREGEAHFTVTKDPLRPFIVTARGIAVRAVGTAFNVRLDSAVVEVLVTEGRVQVDHGAEPTAAGAAPMPVSAEELLIPVLEARQRAVVSLSPSPAPPEIATLTVGEIERVLAWQHPRLEFTATPLAEIVAEFNRRNAVRLVVSDPELASVRISATLRSNNIEGFVRLLESGFDVHAQRRGSSEILLRREPAASKTH